MLANDYQRKAMRTVNFESLVNCGLGLAGEAGEVADIIKKAVFHGHDLDKEALVEELGDCLWYIAVTARLMEISLADVMKKNIDKLRKRYPNGFEIERSINRENN